MKTKRRSARTLIFLCALLLALLPATPVMAGMLDTNSLITAAGADAERAALVQRLGSAELQSALVRMGVNPADAQVRMDRLTDAQVTDLSARLDQLPAGAGALEVVLIVFLVFVITDALGITDIFAFVTPNR
ncbi:MAG: PA2779 family protein [Thioalkalivibrio sp.]|nr:PA2779 family protein [Thioalkalivibrio sp.]